MSKKIGARTIKTAICVTLCGMFFLLLKCLEFIPGLQDSNIAFMIYNPFFACIATAYTVHASKKSSLVQAKNRCFGSLIGGMVGMIIVLIYDAIPNISWPILGPDMDIYTTIVPYLITGFATILTILIGLRFKLPGGVFIAVLTLTSVTINPNGQIVNATIFGGKTWLGVIVFGSNRIFSTIVGTLIALGVNLFRLPHKYKNKNLLFCLGIEGLVKKEGTANINGYLNYKLNDATERGINVSLFTTRAPFMFMHWFDDTTINNPVCCFSGAAMYDPIKHQYKYVTNIDAKTVDEVDALFDKYGIYPVKNYIKNDTQIVSFESIDGANGMYFNQKKDNAYASFIVNYDKKGEILYYLIVDTKEGLLKVIDRINETDLKDKLFLQLSEPIELFGDKKFCYLKIYSIEVKKLMALREYCCEKEAKLVGVTADELSNTLLDVCDYPVSTTNVKTERTEVIRAGSTYDSLFRVIHKMYYKKME